MSTEGSAPTEELRYEEEELFYSIQLFNHILILSVGALPKEGIIIELFSRDFLVGLGEQGIYRL